MVIIIGAPRSSRRFVDDEVDDAVQADDTGAEMNDDADGMIILSQNSF